MVHMTALPQARQDFLTECGRLMEGNPFYLEALSFDSSKDEDKFKCKKVVDSVQDARDSFQPVSWTSEEAATRKQAKKESVQTKKVNLKVQLQELLRSTLDEHEKEKQYLQKELAEAKRKLDVAQQFEISTQCCICKSELVQIVGGQVSILDSLTEFKYASIMLLISSD